MLLLVDIGNSNTKFKLSDEPNIFEIQTSDNYLPVNFEAVIPALFRVHIDGAIISSVVPKASIPVVQFIKNFYNVVPLMVNADYLSNIEFPPIVHNELGADILCSIEGASLISKTFLTVDCGTATTFNYVENGKFVGCAIAPGLVSSHRALTQSTALIHYVDLNGPFQLLGLSTDQCVRSGSLNGFAFLIDGFITTIKNQYKQPDLTVYITGGVSRLIAPLLKNSVVKRPDLVFSGLTHLYLTNKDNK